MTKKAPSQEELDRIALMKKYRFEKKWTLQAIGEMFGVTKERVRQLIGNTGHMKLK
jgi:DNA-directed RNA polymerase sigma subunit (sigma70/sigma32)